jgi:hypothetical protein
MKVESSDGEIMASSELITVTKREYEHLACTCKYMPGPITVDSKMELLSKAALSKLSFLK